MTWELRRASKLLPLRDRPSNLPETINTTILTADDVGINISQSTELSTRMTFSSPLPNFVLVQPKLPEQSSKHLAGLHYIALAHSLTGVQHLTGACM